MLINYKNTISILISLFINTHIRQPEAFEVSLAAPPRVDVGTERVVSGTHFR